jgi:hypothetical protein
VPDYLPKAPGRFVSGQPYRATVRIGATVTVGLVLALVGDGWWDAEAWACLAAPFLIVAVVAVVAVRGRRRGGVLPSRVRGGVDTP